MLSRSNKYFYHILMKSELKIFKLKSEFDNLIVQYEGFKNSNEKFTLLNLIQ